LTGASNSTIPFPTTQRVFGSECVAASMTAFTIYYTIREPGCFEIVEAKDAATYAKVMGGRKGR
jgi:hypothetical protein